MSLHSVLLGHLLVRVKCYVEYNFPFVTELKEQAKKSAIDRERMTTSELSALLSKRRVRIVMGHGNIQGCLWLSGFASRAYFSHFLTDLAIFPRTFPK